MRQARRWATEAVGSAAAGFLMAAAAWACVSGPALQLSTLQAKAGQEIGVIGTGFSSTSPDATLVRFNALDGPVLANVPGPLADGRLDTKVTVPEGTKPGQYVLIVTRQNAQGTLSVSPIRAALSVIGEGGTQPVLGAAPSTADSTARVQGMARSDNSISGGTLALIALGVGGVGMFLAGTAALFAGRRGSAPEAARVRS